MSKHIPLLLQAMNSLNNSFVLLPLLAVVLISSYCRAATALTDGEKTKLKTYIVHVHPPQNTLNFKSSTHRNNWYKSFLPSSPAESRMVHAYTHVITGFAARLTEEEVNEMSKAEGFIGAYPSNYYSKHTTRTPEFLGLNVNLDSGLWNKSSLGKGAVVGVVDGGLDPHHPSFGDAGIPPPPPKWKGRCEYNASLCSNKLIGARSFYAAAAAEANITGNDLSPYNDVDGHATHVASTATGAFVHGAGVLASGVGTASGMAPHAHIAIYRVCDFDEPGYCHGADVLAGVDAAVADGVDVLSISLGLEPSVPFDEAEVSVATFGAIKKGVFPSCSAGNGGPDRGSVLNDAPWQMTVAASTLDRRIAATVELGNGLQLEGESLYQPKEFGPDQFPLVYAGASCKNGSLDGLDIKGKIVLCDPYGGFSPIEKGEFVKSAGGAAMVVANGALKGYTLFAEAHALPASEVSFADGSELRKYINTTANATAAISFKGGVIENRSHAPATAYFSSRGPSTASPGILKPDITAPGVNIIAASPPSLGYPSPSGNRVYFNIKSGTSMAAPHIAGIAALLKSAHPDWSPAAVKSAIMTTADVLDHAGGEITDERRIAADLFAVGAGHVDPNKAGDPGLVYDVSADDYVRYLCGLGYNDTQVQIIAGHPIDCSAIKSIKEADLNYPTISVLFGSGNISSITLARTVRNVGEAESTYWAEVEEPEGVSVTLEPRVLQFEKVNQELRFRMTLTPNMANTTFARSQGYLKWVSKKHIVRSPISVVF